MRAKGAVRTLIATFLVVALAVGCGGHSSDLRATKEAPAAAATTTAQWIYVRALDCVAPPASGTAKPLPVSSATCDQTQVSAVATTSATVDSPASTVILPVLDDQALRFVLGPASLATAEIAGASPVPAPNGAGFDLRMNFTTTGAKTFILVAGRSHASNQQSTARQEAIEVDGQVIGVPVVGRTQPGDTVLIASPEGQPFTLQQATDLARQITSAVRGS